MKSQLTFLRIDKICKAKKKITTAILILAMAATSIAVSGSHAQAKVCPVPTEDYDAIIDFYCSSFNIRDTSGNILFEVVDCRVTQQDMQRVKYTYKPYYDGPDVPITGIPPEELNSLCSRRLTIKGCKYFIITCTIENSYDAAYYTEYTFFDILTSSKAEQYFGKLTPNMEISVFDDEIESEIPTIKLQWRKVKDAERYVIDRNRSPGGYICYLPGEEKIAVTKKPNYTVRNVKGTSYKIRAQKKVKGRWKTIKTIELTLY